MKLRQKLIFLAIAPLIVALCAIAIFVRQQATSLARQQHATIQQAYLASKQAELEHYIQLASHAIAHLTASGRTTRPRWTKPSASCSRSASATTAISSSTTCRAVT
jgi:signal transduction histidine kinase